MNLREAMQDIVDRVENDSLPCTEAAREIRIALSHPDPGDGCSIVDICNNEPVLDYDHEPF